jgi:hypothetical protein
MKLLKIINQRKINDNYFSSASGLSSSSRSSAAKSEIDNYEFLSGSGNNVSGIVGLSNIGNTFFMVFLIF